MAFSRNSRNRYGKSVSEYSFPESKVLRTGVCAEEQTANIRKAFRSGSLIHVFFMFFVSSIS